MRPYGFELDRVTVRDAEAELLRDAATRLLSGESLRSVVNRLNEAGHRTPGGNYWQPVVLKRILTSDRIAGRRKARDGSLRRADWPPIIDDLTRKRLVALLTDKSRDNTNGGAQRTVYLLGGGLARCGLCGAQLVARPNNTGRRGYVCSTDPTYGGCGRIRISAEPFENDVAERVLGRLLRESTRAELRHAIETAQADAISAERLITDAQARLREAGAAFADGLIGGTEFKAASARLNERIATARSSLKLGAMLDSVKTVNASDLVEWWESASIEQQQVLLRLLIESIEVHPAKVRGSKLYDYDRVRVVWR